MVETTNENLSVNRLVSEKNEVIFVEGDMIVPDSKPDILNTINTSGNVCIYKKEVMDEKIRLDGSINTYIMYMADNSEESVRGLNTNLDFSENVNIPNCTSDMMSNTNVNIKSIECKILNGRKINIRVGLEVNVKIYSNEDVEIVNKINNNNDIQVLEENLNVNSLVGCGNTKVYAKDTISIDNTDNLAEILKANVNLVDRDIKISYNKVLAKAEAEVRIMYLTEENKINTIVNKIPVVSFIDIQNVNEGNLCDTNYEIKNMIIKPNNVEEHSIYIELEVEVSCMVYEEKQINLIQDLYSPIEKVTFNTRNIRTMSNKNNMQKTCQIREKVNIPEIENKNLVDVDVIPKINKENKIGDKITYEGELQFNFIFMSASINDMSSKKVYVPFQFDINDIKNVENMNIITNMEITSQDFVLQAGGDVNCNIDILFELSLSQNINLSIIQGLDIEENRDLEDYSLILYIVKKDDTLWKIAKKFSSTIDDIVRVNGIENPDKIEIGQKLFIPKYVKNSGKSNAESNIIMNYV